MRELCEKVWRDEQGQDLTEYALILVLVSLVAVAILRSVGTAVYNTYSDASSNFTTAVS
ncbi:MAG TPA: Flp family type IVb pilin [Terriglobia bacterium]|nr:Flp family type IVb pilin [Terriglobia bacterium]